MKDEDDTPAHLYEEKVVSLNIELANLEHDLRGAQILAELLANNDMPTAEADRQAPGSVVAILALADARLQQLRRVIGGKPMHGTCGRRTTPSARSRSQGMRRT